MVPYFIVRNTRKFKPKLKAKTVSYYTQIHVFRNVTQLKKKQKNTSYVKEQYCKYNQHNCLQKVVDISAKYFFENQHN